MEWSLHMPGHPVKVAVFRHAMEQTLGNSMKLLFEFSFDVYFTVSIRLSITPCNWETNNESR
jgi:hypothetical protein